MGIFCHITRIYKDVIEHYALHARVKKHYIAALIIMNGS